jgi:hypothetical protein
MSHVTNAHLVFEVGTQEPEPELGFWERRTEAWEERLFEFLDRSRAFEAACLMGIRGDPDIYPGHLLKWDEDDVVLPYDEEEEEDGWSPGMLSLSEREYILGEAASDLRPVAESVRSAKENGDWDHATQALYRGEVRLVFETLRERYSHVVDLIVRPGETLRSVLKEISDEIFLESEEGRLEGALVDHFRWFRQAREMAGLEDRPFSDSYNDSTEVESEWEDYGRSSRTSAWLTVKPRGFAAIVPGLNWEEVLESTVLSKLSLEKRGHPDVRGMIPARMLGSAVVSTLVKKYDFLAEDDDGRGVAGQNLAVAVARQAVQHGRTLLMEEAARWASNMSWQTQEVREAWCLSKLRGQLAEKPSTSEGWRMTEVRQLDRDIRLLNWLISRWDQSVEVYLGGRAAWRLVAEMATAVEVKTQTGRSVLDLPAEEGGRKFALLFRAINSTGLAGVVALWNHRFGGIVRGKFSSWAEAEVAKYAAPLIRHLGPASPGA